VEEGVIPALSCSFAVIHRMLVEEGVCYPCAAMQASCCCDPQNALKKKGYACAAMQARCCCDPQNALVEEGVLSRAAMQARCQ
jgi:hypothetical protein